MAQRNKKAGVASEISVEPDQEAKTEVSAELIPEVGSETDTQSEVEPEKDTQSEPEAEPEKDTQPEPKSEADTGIRPCKPAYKITCPNQISKTIGGVDFVKGVGYSTDSFAASWFANKGYLVEVAI